MYIGVISDTHGHLDTKVFNYFDQVDEIWHAGDIGSLTVLEELQKFKPLRAVYGNIDGSNIRHKIREYEIFQLESMSILLIHIAGKFGSYSPQTRELIALYKPTILVCGHSHILKIAFDNKNQILYMNPGAAGNQGFHQVKTLVRFELLQADIRKLEVIELGRHS